MILISHRGNINGKNSNLENMPEYVNSALVIGYNVEIDVWYNKGFWLGHDEPKYRIQHSFLQNQKLWCHAKNLEAVIQMRKISNVHYFWHQKDNITLTSLGYIWAYPGIVIKDSIAVLPEINDNNIENRIGICSDYIEKYKK
tara:strand:- start:922 stop:1347 length:426 start_codon:yes stop_codon:yes gene_type:complete